MIYAHALISKLVRKFHITWETSMPVIVFFPGLELQTGACKTNGPTTTGRIPQCDLLEAGPHSMTNTLAARKRERCVPKVLRFLISRFVSIEQSINGPSPCERPIGRFHSQSNTSIYIIRVTRDRPQCASDISSDGLYVKRGRHCDTM